MDRIDVVTAHHERAVVRVGDVFLKIDTDQANTDVEVAAMARAPVPTPEVLWRRPPVLALAGLPGRQLERLGQPSSASTEAWRATGAALRELHEAPLPPWDHPKVDVEARIAAGCTWLAANGVIDDDLLRRARRIAQDAVRDHEPRFIHGDLQCAHVFIDDDQVAGVIDWSDAGCGDPLFDIAVLTMGHPERMDDLLVGYGGDVDRSIVRGWWAVRCLAAVQWLVEHDFDPAPEISVLESLR